jgi:hypothetical protein
MAPDATSQALRSLRLAMSASVISKLTALETALSICGDEAFFPNINLIP